MNTHFTFTPAIVRSLMEIEAARETVRLTVLPPQVVERLRQEARVRSTHYSTRIEGNRLTLVEAEQAVLAGRRFPGRERDVREVQNYYRALQRVEEWAEQQVPVTEELIRRLHALIFRGPRSKPTPYRDGQNVVRDTVSGELIYMPPEAGDAPGLVADLAAWIAQAGQEGLPVPVIAGPGSGKTEAVRADEKGRRLDHEKRLDHERRERTRKVPFRVLRGISCLSWSKCPCCQGVVSMPNPPSTRGHDFEPLSHAVIGACIDVQRQLGLHCMEVDYQRALELALPKHGLCFQREVEIPLAYDGVIVTRRRVDFVIWNDSHELIMETKARSEVLAEDIEQCLLYLHQGNYRLCLLVNFGQKPLGVRRLVHTPAGERVKDLS